MNAPRKLLDQMRNVIRTKLAYGGWRRVRHDAPCIGSAKHSAGHAPPCWKRNGASFRSSCRTDSERSDSPPIRITHQATRNEAVDYFANSPHARPSIRLAADRMQGNARIFCLLLSPQRSGAGHSLLTWHAGKTKRPATGGPFCLVLLFTVVVCCSCLLQLSAAVACC